MSELNDQTLRDDTRELLRTLSTKQYLSNFFLVGGTALAMYYNHRESIDIDLFSFDEFSTEELLIEIEKDFSDVERIGQTRLSLNLLIDGVKVDLINHPYPILGQSLDYAEIKIASITDIAAMKINAVCGRGSKKDFVDIYFLLREFSMSRMLDLFVKKYPNTTMLMAIKSLAYFDDAEEGVMPKMIEPTAWEKVKKEITKEVNNLK